MRKLAAILMLAALAVGTAAAHFAFVTAKPGGKYAVMFLSETLEPDAAVSAKILEKSWLKVRNEAGTDTDLKPEIDGGVYKMEVPGTGNRVIHGRVDLGVMQRGPTPNLLLYYTKSLLGEAWGDKAVIGGDQVVELVPYGEPGKVMLKMLVRGKPLEKGDITVVLPDGDDLKLKTNSEGFAGPITQTGRIGAWARHWEVTGGERDGKKYDQVRHYGMLVFDSLRKPVSRAALKEATSSFGAAVDANWLYIYGGHIANTHNYSVEAVSGRFGRMNLETGAWEELPGATKLQGMNLASHGGKIYRVGGMEPRNKAGEKADNHSVAEVARFDPAKKQWEALAPLPEGRSSHDVVVIGDQLIVTGGWTMKGKHGGQTWAKTTCIMDLSAAKPTWREVPQPFQRRALIAAAHNGKMYVIGGITEPGAVSQEVDIYDPAKNEWTKGPAMPGTPMESFAPAAVSAGGRLYVSQGDGGLLRLAPEGAKWIAMARTSPRLAHRMIAKAGSDALWIVGGASKGKNLDLVEEVVTQ